MSMSKGRGATARYKAMLEDVRTRVYHALYVGRLDNPYPVDDKRHDRFARQLAHAQRMDAEFDDMCEVMGDDKSRYQKRHYTDPGPVLSLDDLGQRWLSRSDHH